MSWRLLSPASAATCVTLLISCAWLGSAAQPSSVPKKGRALLPLTPQEKNVCSQASEEDFLNSTLSTRLLPALYSVVLLVGLPANVLACWVLATNFRRCSSTIFLLNLAGADLLFVLLLPFKISYHLLGNHWPFGDYLCRAMVAFFYGNMYSSIFFLTCIGLERYISVAHPFLWKGSSWMRGKVGICVGIWLLVGLGMSPLLLRSHTHNISRLNITTCHDVLEKDTQMFFGYYFLFLVGLGFGLPFVLMIISYSCILARLLAKGGSHVQVVRVLALVLLVFILCFTPSNVMLFIHHLLEPTGCNNGTYISYTLALVVSACNNCFDPFIYFYVSRDFRGWVRDAGGRCLQRLEASSGRSTEKTALPLRSSEQSQGCQAVSPALGMGEPEACSPRRAGKRLGQKIPPGSEVHKDLASVLPP